jgi:hypothetical protein
MKGMNPHLTNKGSNPSPGAHLEEISVGFKKDGCGREPKAVKAVTRRQRRINAPSSFNDATTVVTSSPTEEKQARTSIWSLLSRELASHV